MLGYKSFGEVKVGGDCPSFLAVGKVAVLKVASSTELSSRLKNGHTVEKRLHSECLPLKKQITNTSDATYFGNKTDLVWIGLVDG